MANQQDIEETYNFMDEVIRLSFGENADITCALYNGDFSKTLKQAQKDKHDYILNGINFKPGFRVLDIGCGWGPVLKAVKDRGGHAIGLTLSTKQGALNYQIEHHLFPTMPRHKLREAQQIVRAYCEQHSIPYHETGMLQSYREILGYLHEVSAPLREKRPEPFTGC